MLHIILVFLNICNHERIISHREEMKIYSVTGFSTSFWSLDTDTGNIILSLVTARWGSWEGNTTQLILIQPELSAPPWECHSIYTSNFICKQHYLGLHSNLACDAKRFLNKTCIQRFCHISFMQNSWKRNISSHTSISTHNKENWINKK